MPLDFAVLDPNGRIDQYVPIGPDAHHEIVSIASQNAFELILRFRDFYEDATVPIESFPSLSADIAALQQTPGVSEESRLFLSCLADLIGYAAEQGRPIQAISD
jgi:hypothetical protein